MRPLVLVGLLLLPNSFLAQNATSPDSRWLYFGANELGQAFVDTSSLRSSAPGEYRVWVRFNLTKPSKDAQSGKPFNYAVNLAQSQLTNLASAESGIRDADMAAESANLTKAQILLQAGIAALAQANSAPQQVLTLLKQ